MQKFTKNFLQHSFDHWYIWTGAQIHEENQEIHTCETKKYMWNLAFFILWEDVLLQTASILPSPALLQLLLPQLQQCQPSPFGHNIELAFIKIKKVSSPCLLILPGHPAGEEWIPDGGLELFKWTRGFCQAGQSPAWWKVRLNPKLIQRPKFWDIFELTQTFSTQFQDPWHRRDHAGERLQDVCGKQWRERRWMMCNSIFSTWSCSKSAIDGLGDLDHEAVLRDGDGLGSQGDGGLSSPLHPTVHSW